MSGITHVQTWNANWQCYDDAMDTPFAGGKLTGFYQSFLDRLDRPGWRKFASAMVALGLGFLLAIYSGVFAQQGRIVTQTEATAPEGRDLTRF